MFYINTIEVRLENIGWKVIVRHESNLKMGEHNYRWVISRSQELDLYFEIDPESELIYNNVVPPISDAYSCFLSTSVSLCFYKKGSRWNSELEKFLTHLNSID